GMRKPIVPNRHGAVSDRDLFERWNVDKPRQIDDLIGLRAREVCPQDDLPHEGPQRQAPRELSRKVRAISTTGRSALLEHMRRLSRKLLRQTVFIRQWTNEHPAQGHDDEHR